MSKEKFKSKHTLEWRIKTALDCVNQFKLDLHEESDDIFIEMEMIPSKESFLMVKDMSSQCVPYCEEDYLATLEEDPKTILDDHPEIKEKINKMLCETDVDYFAVLISYALEYLVTLETDLEYKLNPTVYKNNIKKKLSDEKFYENFLKLYSIDIVKDVVYSDDFNGYFYKAGIF